jgi:ferredoxin
VVSEGAAVQVTADTSVCVASGQCALLAPRTFSQRDEDGIVLVLDAEPPPADHDAVRHAVLTCPSGALHLVEP